MKEKNLTMTGSQAGDLYLILYRAAGHLESKILRAEENRNGSLAGSLRARQARYTSAAGKAFAAFEPTRGPQAFTQEVTAAFTSDEFRDLALTVERLAKQEKELADQAIESGWMVKDHPELMGLGARMAATEDLLARIMESIESRKAAKK